MFEIKIVQGDTSPVFKFQRKDATDSVIKTQPQKMWVTFKTDSKNEKALFQKTLDNGISFDNNDGYYRFQILPADTERLCYGKYGFDIAILNENGEKVTLLNNGVLSVLEHYTQKHNEV